LVARTAVEVHSLQFTGYRFYGEETRRKKPSLAAKRKKEEKGGRS